MRFPWALGVTGCGVDGAARQNWELIQRLAGDGYSRDPDSLRDTEVRSIAIAPAIGTTSIERAFWNSLPGRSYEALRDWEIELRLPNDTVRTIAERQVRVAAHEQAQGPATTGALEALIRRLAPGALVAVHANDAARVVDHDAEEQTIWNVCVQITEEAYNDERIRRRVVDALRLMMPARHRGQHTIRSLEAMIVVDVGAVLDHSLMRLDRVALRAGSGVSDAHDYPTPARHVDYGPLTTIRAQDLNAIQDQMLVGPTNGAGHFNATGAGGALCFFKFTVAAAGTVTLDASLDWKDRLIAYAHAYNTGALDIRPGGANDGDDAPNCLSESTLFLSGAGGVGYDETLPLSGLVLRVNASGDLQINNPLGATAFGYGLAWATGDLGNV